MARNRIRGITVEIGGDTTKLDRALAGTNKNISTTQSKLKDVERLLKLDPKNVELLDQKQRLLAQSVEFTSDKLKTLKEVAENSTVSNVKYAEWEKALTSIQGQITKTSKALSDMEAGQKQLADLGFSYDSSEMVDARERTEALRDKLESLQKQVTDTYEALGRPISIDQWDDLQRELAESADNAKKAQDSFDSFNPALSRFGSAAQEVSDKAGLVADATRGISVAAGGLLTAMLGTVPATEELRSSLSKLETNAQLSGVGLEAAEQAMQELNRVSDETDSSVEALSNLLAAGVTESNLQKAVENLAGAAIKFPGTVKIESLADSLQETIATGEATGQFAEVLDRLGVGVDGFNDQLSQVPGEADKLNFALDTLANQGMSQFYGSWVQSNQAMVDNKDASLELMQSLSDMAASLTPIVTTVTEFATRLLDWFTDLSPGAKTAIVSILGVTAAISPVAGLISNVGGAISTVTKVAEIFTGGVGDKVYMTFAKWALIIGGVVLAVTALIAMINVLLGKSQDVSSAMNSISGVTSGATQMGGGPGPYSGGSGPYSGGPAPVSLDDYPHFASGGVFAPNNPMLGVLGDNRTEREIAAPESTLRETFLDAVGAAGLSGRQNISVNVRFSGNLAQLGRVLGPVITAEAARMGPQLVGG